MMCVNDTLPPRARARWLLITMRLSIRSLTGTERTLVAVGTVRLASMFCAVRAGAPRRTVRVGSSLAVAFAGFSGSLGTGLAAAAAGWAGRASARVLAVAGEFDFTVVFAAGLAAFAAGSGAFAGLVGVADLVDLADLGALGGSDDFVCPLAAPSFAPFVPPEALFAKKSHHTLSTLFGSCWYCSYISSTSHSLAPNSASGSSADWLPADCPADDAPFEDSATAAIASSTVFLCRTLVGSGGWGSGSNLDLGGNRWQPGIPLERTCRREDEP